MNYVLLSSAIVVKRAVSVEYVSSFKVSICDFQEFVAVSVSVDLAKTVQWLNVHYGTFLMRTDFVYVAIT